MRSDEKVQSVTLIHTHTHTHTSAWNVVGASAAKRTENGVRERSGEERGGHEGERDQWKEYE